MPRRQPVCFELVPMHTVQRLISGRGEKGYVWFTRCIEGQEPDIYELWNFADDGICEVHPYARVQISDNFIRETFHTHFFNAREFRIPFLVCRYVNGSVQWLDIPRPFGETRIATTAWTENIYFNLWGTNPTRIPNVLINLRTVARRARDNLLRDNHVDQRKTLQRDIQARCLSDTRDNVLYDDSDDGWLKEDWSH